MSLRKARAIGAVAACLALSLAALTTPSAFAGSPVLTPADGFLYPGDTLTVQAGDPGCIGAAGVRFLDGGGYAVDYPGVVDAAGDFTVTIDANVTMGSGGIFLPPGGTGFWVRCYDATFTTMVDFGIVHVTVAAGMPAATAAPNPVLTTGTVTITGTNFRPGEGVNLYLNYVAGSPLFIGVQNADPSGTVTWAVKISDPMGDGSVPALQPGSYIADVAGNQQPSNVEAPFTVQAPAPPPGPTSGTMPRLGSDVP